jgi:hypothetical protein
MPLLHYLSCLLQIVQNGITWGSLQWEKFDKPGNPEVPNNGNPSIQWMEMKGLWAIMAVECVLLIALLALTIGLMWVPYIGACRQHRVRRGGGGGSRVFGGGVRRGLLCSLAESRVGRGAWGGVEVVEPLSPAACTKRSFFPGRKSLALVACAWFRVCSILILSQHTL